MRARHARHPSRTDGLATALVAIVVAGTVVGAIRYSIVVAAAVVTVPVILVVGLEMWRRMGRARRRSPMATSEALSGFRWLPAVWVLLTIISNQKLSQRPIDDASAGQLSPEIAVELCFYAGLAVVLVRRWIPRARSATSPYPAWLFAWPLWALLTTAWSVVPKVSVVRGTQLLVVLALTLLTARVLDRQGADGTEFARRFFRLFTATATALALFAFAFPYTYPAPAVEPSDFYADRLAWFGVHPLYAAEFLGVAALVLAVAGPVALRLSFVGWGIRLSVLCVATAQTQGRSVLAGALIAGVVVLWVSGRQRPLLRYLGIPYYVSACVGVVLLLPNQTLGVATRGEGTATLLNLNGRIPVWELALQQLDGTVATFVGFGLGGSRALLSEDIAFAGQAHNSLLEAALSAGVIGVCLLLLLLVALAWRLRWAGLEFKPARSLHTALCAVLALVVLLGVTSPELASPGFSYTLVCFVAVFALRRCPRQPAAPLMPWMARPQPEPSGFLARA